MASRYRQTWCAICPRAAAARRSCAGEFELSPDEPHLPQLEGFIKEFDPHGTGKISRDVFVTMVRASSQRSPPSAAHRAQQD